MNPFVGISKISAFILLACLASASAEVKLNGLFGDNAVLQREAVVPIWGTASPSEKVTVEFAGQTESALADGSGLWKLALDPMPASGESRVLSVRGDKSAAPHEIRNVVVGDVWICSGQSNMERELGLRNGQQPLVNWEAEAASADFPLIRHFHVKNGPADFAQTDLQASWQVCSPQSAPSFTAVGYYFGRDLHKHLKIPIGLINASVGGTPAEAWTSHGVLEAGFPEILANHRKAVAGYGEALALYQRKESALLDQWKKDVEAARQNALPEPIKPRPPRSPTDSAMRPSGLFNGKIAALIPCAVKGVIWYQGEGNYTRPEQYGRLFPAMIADWRARWQKPDLPFLFVQIAPHYKMPPELRNSQLMTWKNTSGTAMVVTSDVGDAEDIHPTRKEPVGSRLALAARGTVYGEKIVYSGPVFTHMTVEDELAVLHFNHTGGGLVAKDGPLRGFTISGDGKTFVPAEADISGKTVKVHAAGVTTPVAARYGWANVPEVNLFNAEGLPASPFRTESD